MNPSSFEMSRSVGESLGKGISNFQEGAREKKDASAIGDILRNAMNSQDPQALNSAMADIMSGISEKGRPAAIKALEGVVDRLDKTRTAETKEKPLSEGEKEFQKGRGKDVGEYVSSSLKKASDAEDLKYTFSEVDKALAGDITGPGFEATLKKNQYTRLLFGLTPDESLLQTANKKLLEGTKGIFGSRPREREIFLLLNDMLPSIGKTREANIVGVEYMKRINDMAILHGDLVSEITEGGSKYVPDLENQVRIRMKPYTDQLREDLKEDVKKVNENQDNEEKKPISKSEQLVEMARKNKGQ